MKTRIVTLLFVAIALFSGRATAGEESPSMAVKLEAGGTYRRIFSLPVVGGEGSLALGPAPRQNASSEPYFVARYAYGQTPEGLAAHTIRAGIQCDFPVGRFRPYLGGEVMWLGFVRATNAELVQHWGIGLNVGATIDIVRTSDRQALYFGPRLALDAFPHKLIPRTFSPNGALVLGYRF